LVDTHQEGSITAMKPTLRASQIEQSLPALSIGLAWLSVLNEGKMMTHGEGSLADTKQPILAENDLGINGRRVESACRYFITFLMLIYGLVKVFQGQFYTDEYWRDTSLRNLDGMQLVWSFYGHSPLYQSLLGLVEVFLGILFLFRRTTALGIVLFVPIMANLVAINFFFQVGALQSAVPLLLAGFVLLFLHWHRLKSFFWDTSGVLACSGTRPWLAPASVATLAVGLAALVLYNNLLRFPQDLKIRGAWQFVGQEPRVKKLYFEKGKTLVIQDDHNELHFVDYYLHRRGQLSLEETPLLPGLSKVDYRFEGEKLVLESPRGSWSMVRPSSNTR